MRGPHRDGVSDEKGLIDKWQLNGQNFLWRAPYGGRSAPVVMGNRVYVQNPAGLADQMQERVMALDADTGKVVWEYKFNVFQSDVPPHRVGWASPAIDPETGNIYAMGVGATVIALNKDGKLLWDHSTKFQPKRCVHVSRHKSKSAPSSAFATSSISSCRASRSMQCRWHRGRYRFTRATTTSSWSAAVTSGNSSSAGRSGDPHRRRIPGLAAGAFGHAEYGDEPESDGRRIGSHRHHSLAAARRSRRPPRSRSTSERGWRTVSASA